MQVLIPCLIFLAVENVRLVRTEQLDAQEVLDSTQFKNAVAKELLKKKLSTLESARQQDSLAAFLRKGGRNLSGLRSAPKSSFHKDDDPSRKQAQMANTFIASSNLLFGTKSQQRKACSSTGKQANKEVLDMQSLRQTYSGYNEEGSEFSASKETPKLPLERLNVSVSSAIQKRSFLKKGVQDPISCYLTEPKKVTCMHKDIIYKIALPSSEVADDEIGRIVESIYRAVEGKSSVKVPSEESFEDAGRQRKSLKDSSEETEHKKPALEDSYKKKRASDDYLKSLFLNNLLVANQKAAMPNYNGNNPIFIPLLIPMSQPKADLPKVPSGYFPGIAMDPKYQIPVNMSVGVDTLNGYQTGRNMFENGYGQYMIPEGFALPELNLKQRSQVNLTAEEERRRNWLALMATNGLVPVENGINARLLTQHSTNGEVQSVAEEKESLSNGNKLTVAETGEVLDKLLNKRQERDTYFLRRQLRTKHNFIDERANFTPFYRDGRENVLSKVVQKLTDPGGFIMEEKKGCPCPNTCAPELCSRSTKKSIRCSSKCPFLKLTPQTTTTTTNPPAPRCSPSPKCPATEATCSEGCQASQGCQPCETSTDGCPMKNDGCRDSDILSKVMSTGMKGKENLQMNQQNLQPPPVQSAHLNWLPYSPQVIHKSQLHHSGAPQQQQEESNYMSYQQQQQTYSSQPKESQSQQTALESGKQPQYSEHSDQYQPNYSIKSYDRMENSEPSQHPSHTQDSPQLNIPSNEHQDHDVHQIVDQIVPNDGSHISIEGSLINNPASGQNEIPSKTVSQPEHYNMSSRQNDLKTKKHRDSFFARLRSKFHKGIPPNGPDLKKVPAGGYQTGQDAQQIPHVQNKALLGTSIFKFNPKNQTSKNTSVSSDQSTNNVNGSLHTTDCQRKCPNSQLTQPNDQLQGSNNQTQPSTINNINITVTSNIPQPGAQEPLVNNQTEQTPQSMKTFIACPNVMASTTQATGTYSQYIHTCRTTRVCPLKSTTSTTTAMVSSQTAQPAMCSTAQSCTFRTAPTSTSYTTQASCEKNNSVNFTRENPKSPSENPQSAPVNPQVPSGNPQMPPASPQVPAGNPQVTSTKPQVSDDIKPPVCTSDKPSTCGSDIPGSSQPGPDSPWSPAGESQVPPGFPLPPPDTSQGGPGFKMKTFFNYPNRPGWNQWQQYPNYNVPPLPTVSSNGQQPSRPFLQTTFMPYTLQQRRTEHTLQPQAPRQPDQPIQPQAPMWYQNSYLPQGAMWQPPQGRPFELDPRWQTQKPTAQIHSIQHPNPGNIPQPKAEFNSGYPQSTGNEVQNAQPMEHNLHFDNKWDNANSSPGPGRASETGKVIWPANIDQHIARVRRYLMKKRSGMFKQLSSAAP